MLDSYTPLNGLIFLLVDSGRANSALATMKGTIWCTNSYTVTFYLPEQECELSLPQLHLGSGNPLNGSRTLLSCFLWTTPKLDRTHTPEHKVTPHRVKFYLRLGEPINRSLSFSSPFPHNRQIPQSYLPAFHSQARSFGSLNSRSGYRVPQTRRETPRSYSKPCWFNDYRIPTTTRPPCAEVIAHPEFPGSSAVQTIHLETTFPIRPVALASGKRGMLSEEILGLEPLEFTPRSKGGLYVIFV